MHEVPSFVGANAKVKHKFRDMACPTEKDNVQPILSEVPQPKLWNVVVFPME